MSDPLPILAHGESYAQPVQKKTGGGPRPRPHEYEEARNRLLANIGTVSRQIQTDPDSYLEEKVVCIRMEPKFEAKSYAPSSVLTSSDELHGTLFIGDDKTVNEGAYQLRTMFDDIIECDIEIDKDAQKNKRVKRTLVSLDELEFKQVLTTLESELIGQIEFKRSFESRSRSFRLFNALDEQPVFSLLLLGPSGVGKTEVAKILCEAIAPCQPLPKVNLGNYSSKDSLNSLIGSPRGYMGSEEGELGKKIDSSDAGILLVDEFEKAEPAVWNFFLDLLETGSFTDSQGMEHDLRGFIIVFTTNCPLGKINETFPAELLSRFNLMSHFSKLSVSDKKFFVERYVSMFAKKYRETAPSGLPTLPDDIADRAMMEIDIEATENIRILKNTTRSWISEFVEKARKSSSIATQPSIINAQT